MKVSTSTLGFPRMGPNRELKFALEKFWKGLISEKELFTVAHSVESTAWTMQQEAGVNRVTVGDHYLYDSILAWTEMLGVAPTRYDGIARGTPRLFAMARGVDGATALSTFVLLLKALPIHQVPPRPSSNYVFSSLLPRRHEEVDHQ